MLTSIAYLARISPRYISLLAAFLPLVLFCVAAMWHGRQTRKCMTTNDGRSPTEPTRLDNRMADEKKTKAKKEKPAAEKVEAKPATEAKTEAPAEARSEAPKNYSRGEGQKAVTQVYKDNWNTIFGKKKR
jgi:hypothetical protein